MSEDPKEAKRGAMLLFIRDVLVERSGAMRAAFELNPFQWCGSPEGKDQLKRIVAVEAAADAFVLILAEWERPEKDRSHDLLRAVVNQSMAAFVEAFK